MNVWVVTHYYITDEYENINEIKGIFASSEAAYGYVGEFVAKVKGTEHDDPLMYVTPHALQGEGEL